jgi:hypothetical protein
MLCKALHGGVEAPCLRGLSSRPRRVTVATRADSPRGTCRPLTALLSGHVRPGHSRQVRVRHLYQARY